LLVSSMHTCGRLGSYGRWYTSSTSSIACTNAAFCSGGMQKRSTRQGLSSFFFQPLPYRFVADAVDNVKLDELVGESMKGPSPSARRGCTARQLHPASFPLAVQLQGARLSLFLALQGRCHSFEHTTLAHSFQRRGSYGKMLSDLFLSKPLIGLEEQVRSRDLLRRGTSALRQTAKFCSFFFGQVHQVAFHSLPSRPNLLRAKVFASFFTHRRQIEAVLGRVG
jgi:hypothetical protein